MHKTVQSNKLIKKFLCFKQNKTTKGKEERLIIVEHWTFLMIDRHSFDSNNKCMKIYTNDHINFMPRKIKRIKLFY